MSSRQQKRAGERAQDKIEARPKVYLPVPEEFLDLMGDPWRGVQNSRVIEMDLPAILMYTLRQAPVKTGGDSIRTLECYQILKDTPDGIISMPKDDWDWMISHFKEMAHQVWKAPDAAYLTRWLEISVRLTPVEPAEQQT